MKKRLVTYLIFILAVFSVGNVWGYTEGDNNFFGSEAGANNTTGTNHSFFGAYSGYLNTEGNANSFFGRGAGRSNTTGSFNTFIGNLAGRNHTTGSYNVFLGYSAGYNETGSNKLYISNSDTPFPLIYGEFDNRYLEVNGTLNVQGVDAYNDFQLKVSGHLGGNSHAQLVTDAPDSRFTFMASEASDQAPRFQLVGPQDVSTGARGWVLADFGSLNYSLPNAQFNIRHYNTSGPVNMMQVVGREKVTFPTGKVGIGTTSPTHLIHLAGGAYSNGATWVNASSRELKENIKEVSAEEAIRTVENLKPVAFNYKKGDQELHVGFIAEDVPELVATNDRKGLESMDIVAVLTKVVQEQQKMIQQQQLVNEELQTKIGKLETVLQFKQDKNANVAKAN